MAKKNLYEDLQREGLLAEPANKGTDDAAPAEIPQGDGGNNKPPAVIPGGNPPGGQVSGNGITPQAAGPDYGTLSDHYLKLYADGQFTYDFNEDPKYQMAREAYLKQGQLSARDVAARAAALTGGYGNSYGTVAAQQTMNAAADRVNQIIPELEANAYSRWNAEQQRNLGLAEMYYGRQQDLDTKALREAQLAAEYGDYSKLNALGYDTSKYEAQQAADQEWVEKQRAQAEKEWANADEDRKREIAERMASYGDYSFLEELGVDTTELRRASDMQKAQELAKYGDYSGLEKLGVDLTQYKRAQQLDEALAIASSVGDYSGLKALGIDVSTAEKQALLKYALQYADVGDLSLLKELGVDVTLLEAQNNYKLGQLSGYGSYGGYSSGGSSSGGGSGSGSGYGSGSGNRSVSDSGGENYTSEKATVSDWDAFGRYMETQGYYSIGRQGDVVYYRPTNGTGATLKYKYNPSTGNFEQV